MTIVRYVLTEYLTPDRPHVVLAQDERTVDLVGGAGAFYAWAAERYPAPQWSAELVVGQLGHDPAP